MKKERNIEENFFTTARWQKRYECLNLNNINEPPSDYKGTSIEWLQDLTTFIYLFPHEWDRIYEEYRRIIDKQKLEGNHNIKYYRDDVGYLRKYGETDIFLKITITGENETVKRFIHSISWEKLFSAEEYIHYTGLEVSERQKYIDNIKKRLKKLLQENQIELSITITFVSNSDASDFLHHDVFVDPLNETYFIL